MQTSSLETPTNLRKHLVHCHFLFLIRDHPNSTLIFSDSFLFPTIKQLKNTPRICREPLLPSSFLFAVVAIGRVKRGNKKTAGSNPFRHPTVTSSSPCDLLPFFLQLSWKSEAILSFVDHQNRPKPFLSNGLKLVTRSLPKTNTSRVRITH